MQNRDLQKVAVYNNHRNVEVDFLKYASKKLILNRSKFSNHNDDDIGKRTYILHIQFNPVMYFILDYFGVLFIIQIPSD